MPLAIGDLLPERQAGDRGADAELGDPDRCLGTF